MLFYVLNETFSNERKIWRRKPNKIETNMKKLILFAALFGLTAGISAYADDATNNATADSSVTNNWTADCVKCHGADGKGQTKMGQRLGIRDFTDPKVQADIKDDAAFKALREGLKTDDGKTQMKPFDALTDDQIKALIAYVRTLKAK